MKKLLLTTVAILALSIGSVKAQYMPGTTDGSIVTLLNGQMSVGGLNNVLNFAPNVPINDGNVHTVANAPANSPFYGKTTLAQIAAIIIDGQTPFSFLTGSGATVGPMCTNGTSVNCFTNGVYNLTNTSVANMDIAWLAIEGALITGKAYAPAGKYIVGSTEVLPLMLNSAVNTTFKGDGQDLTFIQAGHEFGQLPGDTARGIHLFSCGDPAGQHTNNLGEYATNCQSTLADYHLIGPLGYEYFTIGSSPVQMDGMALARGETMYNVKSGGFYDDFTLSGSHMSYINLSAVGGVRGLYYIWTNQDLGDNVFWQFGAGGSQAAIAISPENYLQDYWLGETYINGPYAVFGEKGCAMDLAGGVYFQHLMTEWTGNAVFHDDNVYSGDMSQNGTGTYNDANKCRGMGDIKIDKWYNSYTQGSQDHFWGKAGGRRRRATIDVNNLTGTIDGMNETGGVFFPQPDDVGAAGIAFIDTNNIGFGAGGLRLSGVLSNLFGESTQYNLPIFSNNVNYSEFNSVEWVFPGYGGGIFAGFTPEGNHTIVTSGDLMEQLNGSYGSAVPAGYSANAPGMGVAMTSGATGGLIPLATHGGLWASSVNMAYNNGIQGFAKKSSGVGAVTFTPGSGATASGTFNVTATGGGCTTEPVFSVVVSGGAVTSVTGGTSAGGAGCTSAPSISNAMIVSAGATGLTGATITMLWPSGAAAQASSPIDGVIIGTGAGFASGTNVTGLGMASMKPLNMD